MTDINKVVLKFDPKETAAILYTQIKFQDSHTQADLQSITNNYFGLVEAVGKLQNPSVCLLESVQIINDVHSHLCTVENTKNWGIIEKFECFRRTFRFFHTNVNWWWCVYWFVKWFQRLFQ